MGFFTGRPALFRRRFVVPGAVLGLLLVLGAVFALRSPVILVSDAPFTILYGRQRGLLKQAELSLRLFRPVKVALVAEDAGPDMVAFAVEESAKSPHAALFPYRYYEGARRYGEKFPGIPAPVLGRGSPGSDTGADYFRAGLAAALFVQTGPGKVVFFQREAPPGGREAFREGLREGGVEEPPLYLEADAEYAAWPEVSCVVVDGPAGDFLGRNLKIPVILFSWIDPALTPAAVKVIFDDSPWALAFRILEKPGPEGRGGAPVSEMTILQERIGDPEMVRSLQKAVNRAPGDRNF